MARDLEDLEEDMTYMKMTEKDWLLMQRYLMMIHHCQEVASFAVPRRGQHDLKINKVQV